MSDLKTLSDKLKAVLGEGRVRENEPMSAHTTFRAGGPADLYAAPESEGGVCRAVRICREEGVEPFILGNGSNLLVSDAGYRGVVLDLSGLTDCAQVFDSEGCSNVQRALRQVCIEAGAGVKLSALARFALEKGAAGLEFAAGIPGTVGGAAVMNAGAYGGEMKDVLRTVTVLTPEGSIQNLFNADLDLGYRHSCIPEKGYIVLAAEFVLQKGDPEKIRALMDDLAVKRREKQPLEFPSAGSTFKRPEGYFAGKLIQDAGLSGYRIGGACVSPKHCGFVVNDQGGTASDIYRVICDVQEKVFEVHGVKLTMEVKLLGDFS
ncbi:MAG: UDP-N-acetylmuramate dehydrogenase [Lachnospiraceae bacterium]|nr:UDP-N-acetylmuramate dehydrogenase [Lachnospiraceae bacterium]